MVIGTGFVIGYFSTVIIHIYDPYLNSDVLKKYILSQIERIELKGPMNRPPALGVKYQAW